MAEPVIDRDVNDDPIERAVLISELSQLRGRLHVTVTPKRKAPLMAKHSQHGYYRPVVQPIVRQFLNETQGGMDDGDGGIREFTPDEAHHWIKSYLAERGLIGRPVVNRNGEPRGFVVPSCGNMTARQMWDFTDHVVTFLTGQGYRVPPPNKQWREARAAALNEQRHRPGRAA
jgi:hypothetical protein